MVARRILATLSASICIGIAMWMVINTRATFPEDPFIELVPGYIIFPGMMLLWAVVMVVFILSYPRR